VVVIDGVYRLVEGPGKAKKQGITAEAEQVARIETSTKYARIEYADTTVKKYEYTSEQMARFEQLEKEYHFNQAASERRKVAFEAMFLNNR
jgi:cell fate (sporulation/competence/biofilm development) regulator YlbF (YheA/YmcA/DUF963 family)